MKKLIMILCMSLATCAVKSQEKITALVAQDVRLLITGSETYNAGTLNLIGRIQLEGRQDTNGYFSAFFEYEIGDLTPKYNRYSINAQYTFNNLFEKNLETSMYVGYGIIDRGFSKQSFGFGGSVAYKLSKNLTIKAIAQMVDRTDLGYLYNDRQLRTSFFLGVSYTIFKSKL